MSEIHPFTITTTDAALADLRDRLARTRWPEAETPDDWSQGVPLAYARDFCAYWSASYDWGARRDRLNRFPQFTTRLDGLDIHFIHQRSPEPNARPLLITHGWPGSIVEFQEVIAPLSDPVAHGGDAADAFHVVCPSLPGYGFSGKPSTPGWGVEKIADVWDRLMQRLGYDPYFAQGGDWGALVTTAIAQQNLGHCAGIHVNMPLAQPTPEALANPNEKDKLALAAAQHYQQWGSGYSKQQSTRPQTLGYGLTDSPVGQAMWILEKFHAWTDCQGHPENILDRDVLLDNIMLYWLTASGASSARLYWESFGRFTGGEAPISLPTGCSIFPREVVLTPRSWAETRYGNIVYWNELDRGGHFAALEQPALFIKEVQKAFRLMR